MNRDQAAYTGAVEALAIDARAVTRRLGTRWILRGAELQLPAGSVLALTGRNGSGKTTLLRILSTLLLPSRGTVRIFGHDTRHSPDHVRSRLGYLAHNPGIYDDLTADENLAFAQRMSGSGADAAQRTAILERVGLTDAARERVRGFSAGMRRRLALGRILLSPVTLLLLDEPYASFDADGITLVNDVARETAARGGAVVIATHDLERATLVIDARMDIRDGILHPMPVISHATSDTSPSSRMLAVQGGA